MICKECGAMVKNKEEYCRKCGALVINFNRKENPSTKNICIKNNIKGKFRNLINLFSNSNNKSHNVNKINNDRKLNKVNHLETAKNMLNKDNLSESFKDLSNKIDFYMKDTLGFDEDNNDSTSSESELNNMINDFKNLFK